MVTETLRLVAFASMALTPAAASAAEAWTFCVAESRNGADVFISDVFPAESGREEIEAAFRNAVERLSGPGADAQCPQPQEDEPAAVSAQFDAEAFNRKMGAALHAVPTKAFLGARQAASPEPSRTSHAAPKPDILPVGSSGKPLQ